jgi:hypothetical protein
MGQSADTCQEHEGVDPIGRARLSNGPTATRFPNRAGHRARVQAGKYRRNDALVAR